MPEFTTDTPPESPEARPGLGSEVRDSILKEMNSTPNIDKPVTGSSRNDVRTIVGQNPGIIESAIGAAVLLAWVGFFGAGVLVSTKMMRDGVASGKLSILADVGCLMVIFACYTVTNLFFLACTSSLLGCMASRWQVGVKPAEITIPVRQMYAAAILRGFLLYTFVISGFLVVSNESTIVDTTLAQYVRLGGFISALGFIVGYEPQLIFRWVAKAESVANTPVERNK